MDRERREDHRLPDDAEIADEFKVSWGDAGDKWTEAVEDKDDAERPSRRAPGPERDVPWDELADDSSPEFEEASFVAAKSRDAVPDPEDDAAPHGDPLEHAADEAFERDRPATRMDTLQDALSSIRERVQSLSSTVQAPGQRPGASQLALYRAATDDRSYAELRRHSRETEDLLRRMSAMMQDLSLDLRSIVDAARRAIDQTSEQAESSIELGRLLGERIEQMDGEMAERLDAVDGAVVQRVEQIDAAVGSLQVHLDKRLTKLEQRAGVGVVREEVAELRADMGDVRTELGTLRDEVGAIGDAGSAGLQDRLGVVGAQLDRTLTVLTDLVEGVPGQDDDMVDGVVEAIKTETEAAVEPFRTEVEELGRQLGEALDREEQLGATLVTLTEEVQRLRKRIAVRSAPPTIDEEQIQSIVDAVVAALPGDRPPVRGGRRPAPAPDQQSELGDELDVEPEPEPEPEPKPAPRARKKRTVRPARAKKAAPVEEPDYELDINQPFAPGELEISEAEPDTDVDEEPIRRARGSGRKTNRPLTKGKRTRSSSR